MMKLTCKDITPDTDCHFVAIGETAPEAAEIMMAHAKLGHTKDIDKMEMEMSESDILALFESKVHR